ncbi:MAG: GtrA family protein [Acholeplasmatales bacterium]|nr:GtrA family protein [Acholeplasmatales bacterium]
MLTKIKRTFFNKSFLTFCIIGGFAYLIHQGIYLLYTKAFNFYDDKNHLRSTAIAFAIASLFTYFANAKFTYDTKASNDTAIKSIIVFILKFFITEGLTLGIMAIMNHNFESTDLFYKIVDILLPLILTCITLILQFIAFNIIFKSKNSN